MQSAVSRNTSHLQHLDQKGTTQAVPSPRDEIRRTPSADLTPRRGCCHTVHLRLTADMSSTYLHELHPIIGIVLWRKKTSRHLFRLSWSQGEQASERIVHNKRPPPPAREWRHAILTCTGLPPLPYDPYCSSRYMIANGPMSPRARDRVQLDLYRYYNWSLLR